MPLATNAFLDRVRLPGPNAVPTASVEDEFWVLALFPMKVFPEMVIWKGAAVQGPVRGTRAQSAVLLT